MYQTNDYSYYYSVARVFAEAAYKERTDKVGMPYILHLLRVSDSLRYDRQKTIALLHDVLNETWIDEQLLRHFFPDDVCNSVVTLTRKNGESFADFIDRIIASNDEDAICVKIEDLNDKLNLGRFEDITDEDIEQIKIYFEAKKRLKNFLNDEYL